MSDERYYNHQAYLATQQPARPQWEALEEDAPIVRVDHAPLAVQPMPVELPTGARGTQTDTALTNAQATGIRFKYMLVLAVAFGLLLAILGALWGWTGPGASIVLGMFGTVTVGAIGFIWLNGQDHKHSVHGVERQRGEIMQTAVDHQAEINHAIVENDRRRSDQDHEYRMEKMRLYQQYLRGGQDE